MSELEQSLDMHKFHVDATTQLYRNDYKQKLEALAVENKEANENAKKVYKEVYDQISGSDEERDLVAYHESGYQDIGDHFQAEEEALESRMQDMANYFNKSSLVITYALLENQLRRLCEIVGDISKKRLSVHDLDDRNYINTCFTYFEKVIELPIDPLESQRSVFKDLQYLRNRIMHNGGEFPDKKEFPELGPIIASSGGLLELTYPEEPYEEFKEEQTIERVKYKYLRIKKAEYLQKYFEAIDEVFQEIFWMVDEHFNNSLIGTRLLFLFGFLSKELSYEDIKIVKIKRGKQITLTLRSTEAGNLFTFECKITMTTGSKNKLSIVNQIDDNANLKRLIDYLNKHSYTIYNELLYGFNIAKSYKNIKIMLF